MFISHLRRHNFPLASIFPSSYTSPSKSHNLRPPHRPPGPMISMGSRSGLHLWPSLPHHRRFLLSIPRPHSTQSHSRPHPSLPPPIPNLRQRRLYALRVSRVSIRKRYWAASRCARASVRALGRPEALARSQGRASEAARKRLHVGGRDEIVVRS
jgi:hypothetical protein